MQATDILDAETAAMRDARRAMEVCNACRYCEGFCAVFPAMELRREFSGGDLTYLANLCHGCNGCFYSCQYAPPHEFGINVPATFAELRMESYERFAWPAPLASLYQRNGMVVALAMAAGAAGALLLTMLLRSRSALYGAHPVAPGSFYSVIPYAAMAWVAGISFVFSLVALGFGFANFWRAAGGASGELKWPPLRQALRDAATLRYLGGGGHGCNDSDGRFSTHRRMLHHAMAYGFLLCFASTCVATICADVLEWDAPYSFLSLPVLLGTAGGMGMVVGCGGLFWLKLAGDQEPRAAKLLGADAALLLLLFLIALTGLLLLAVRATGAMGATLAVHLGLVLALFATLPYSKFVHGIYRFAALARHAIERPEGMEAHPK